MVIEGTNARGIVARDDAALVRNLTTLRVEGSATPVGIETGRLVPETHRELA